ncbi:tetratricopeptide repeat-containing response regulator [Noviherbaspirillum saxi]|uniref:Response regulator n=1 Tax=Noviherbaspirillum saxi TaxID=2320863 RepID=A0A3A3GC26_9BURK|nr:tetratricopeptide repeat-containing response regulator [Noviherbaspirillum saxi]RJF99765.1 response regulator [Noviherbaspirillum saxi]
MTSLRSLTALIVEPQSGMRANLHNMLNLCGITKIDHAVSSGTAIRPLKNKSYDLILCEYDLGDGQDGQQLLEDLRHNKLIPLWTVFIIVTAERVYEKVVSAAELAPTDYILKPFTADTLLDRIGKAIEKRTAFLPVYHLMEHGNLHEAIEICQVGEEKYRRYATDFMRLRAELHVILGEAEAAEAIYQALLATKVVAWARLGLAKTLFMQQKFGEAEMLLKTLVEENSKYMDAYDWLAKTHVAIDQLPEAKEVLAGAVAISPHAVRRLRKLGEVALETGDVETAEKSFQKVVAKAKYSEFRDPEDHVRLIRTLVKKGDTQQASTVIRDMEKSLNNIDKTPACRAFSSALVQTELGNAEQAAQDLAVAVAACRQTDGISNDMKMELAKNCLHHNLDEGASEVMRDVMSNAADETALAKAMKVFEQAGRRELAEKVAKESRKQVVELVSSGAEKAKQGDFEGAVALMTAAVRKLPENPQVVFNAAVAVLKYLENVGWDNQRGEQVRGYIESARRLDPNNPRLAPLGELYQAIQKKYGIKPPSIS